MSKKYSSDKSAKCPTNEKSSYTGANNTVAQNDSRARENITKESMKKII